MRLQARSSAPDTGPAQLYTQCVYNLLVMTKEKGVKSDSGSLLPSPPPDPLSPEYQGEGENRLMGVSVTTNH